VDLNIGKMEKEGLSTGIDKLREIFKSRDTVDVDFGAMKGFVKNPRRIMSPEEAQERIEKLRKLRIK